RDVLASTIGKDLQLRRGGIGKPFLDALVPAGGGTHLTNIEWISATRLRMFGDTGWLGYDVAHKRAWKLPRLAAAFGGLIKADGEIAAAPLYAKNGIQKLVLTGPGSASPRVVRTAPA